MSFSSLGQTFDDLKLINNENDFKRVMIESNYQFDLINDDGYILYGYNLIKDSIEGSRSEKWGSYNTKTGGWMIQFNDRGTLIYQYGDYEDITNSIKFQCKYNDIVSANETDYVTYSCDDSKFNGKIGFVLSEDTGYIRFFPNE